MFKKATQFLLRPLKMLKFQLIFLRVNINNAFVKKIKPIKTDFNDFNEIIEKALTYTDFSDHLTTLFTEALSQKPKMIVELGTRGGESTFVLERIAKLCNSTFISVDLDDCSKSSTYSKWIFVQRDDIQFAKEFKTWCTPLKFKPEIDLLFIDTSHLYEHTVEEIKHWFPFLAQGGKVIFHDTNLKYVYSRKDGSLGISGWDNKRGVIRALEDYFDRKYNENQAFIDIRKGWLIRHWPNCSGFSVLEKLPNS